MFCSQCGKDLQESELICPECGHRRTKKNSEESKSNFTQRKTAQSNLLYESKGYPQAYYRRSTIFGFLAIVFGVIIALMSQARHHSSQMNIYSNGTLVHSGTLGGGNMFTSEGQEWLLLMGIFFIIAGVACLAFSQKQKGAFALMLYEDRIDGIKGFQKFTLEYGQVNEVLTDAVSIYQSVTIVTASNKYRIIVTHDAEKAAEIIRMKRKVTIR